MIYRFFERHCIRSGLVRLGLRSEQAQSLVYPASASTGCAAAGPETSPLTSSSPTPVFRTGPCCSHVVGRWRPNGARHTSPGRSPGCGRMHGFSPERATHRVLTAPRGKSAMSHPFRVSFWGFRTQGFALGWYVRALRAPAGRCKATPGLSWYSSANRDQAPESPDGSYSDEDWTISSCLSKAGAPPGPPKNVINHESSARPWHPCSWTCSWT